MDDNSTPIVDKLNANGWVRLDGLTADMDYSQYYFTLLDHSLGLPIVASPSSGDKNWSGTYAMCYSSNANANTDASAVWTIDAFDKQEKGFAIGQNLKKIILTNLIDPKRHFRTEGWSKIVWQTYSDFGKNGNYNSDGNRSIAFLEPFYSEKDGWSFKNQTSEAFIGPWEDGEAKEGQEFSANKTAEQAGYFDIYAISRTKWMQQYENLEKIKGDTKINVSYLITNNSFERFDENRKPIGWVLTGDGEIERDWLNGCDGTLYMNNWQSNGHLSDRSICQTINALPKGKYRLTVYRMSAGENAFLFANDKEQPIGSNGEIGEDVSLDFEIKDKTDVTLGIKLDGFTSNNLKFDNFRLTYLGDSIDDPTNIENVSKTKTQKANLYNILGQKIHQPQKGINIINGKKFVQK